jgi:glycosyltransferase involved in cell wall biosynthesis
MAKILRIINRLNLGGPTLNAALLTRHLAPEYETLLLAGMKDESEASSEFILHDMGLKPRYISSMYRTINPLHDVKAFFEIKRIIKAFRPDIVHTHAAKAGALGRLAAHQCGVPVIVHTFHGHVFHSYFHPAKTRIFIAIEQYLASISNKIIAISDLQKKELSEEFKICAPEKIAVIPLGFDLDKFRQNTEIKRKQFRQDYNLDDDEIAIGIVGRLVPIKNHCMFLQAAKSIMEKTTKKIRFFIIGDGEERKNIENFARETNFPFITDAFRHSKASLTFTSWIKNIDYAYAGLDIVALTSLNEGTPVSLIEAQAAGKPIVSTRVGGIQDIVLEGQTAWLSEKNDLQTFTENMLALIEDESKRKMAAQTARDQIFEKFSYQRLVKQTRDLYAELLKKKA